MVSLAAAKKRNAFRVVLSCLIAALILAGVQTQVTRAADPKKVKGTNVYALICDGVTGAAISIDSPASDTVVSQPQLTISGTVANASQIEERVNGQYNGTIALNPAATSFQAQIILAPGTSTIELTAIDACNVADATDTLVITYSPPVESPDDGGDNPPGGGVGVGNNVTPLTPVDSGGLSIFDDAWKSFARAFDFDQRSSEAAWKNPFRVSFLIAGIGLALLASYIAGWLFSLRRRRLGAVVYTRERSTSKHWFTKKRLIFGLRALGLILIVLTFVI